MNILIADDEELVRVGLGDILMKISPDARIREAVNGRTMIEAVEESQPDICFADIHMPGINGLEAIEHLCLKYPGINWIVLSGYSDFEYARKALTLGVLDYLLKPATEDEVKAALKKAAAKMRESGLQKREKFEYRVGGVLNNSSAFEFDDYLIDIGSYAALVFIPGSKEIDSSVRFQRGLSGEIRDWIDGESQDVPAGLFSVLDGLPVVIAGGGGAVKSLCMLQAYISDSTDYDCRTLITPACSSLPDLLSWIESAPELRIPAVNTLADENPDKISRIVLQAEKLVRQQYDHPIGLAQIAEQLNVTPNYLSMLFKKSTGIPFSKFITDIRLAEAPELLEEPGVTVKEAATRLGYMSSRHFTRLFREKYGMPPTEYINRQS